VTGSDYVTVQRRGLKGRGTPAGRRPGWRRHARPGRRDRLAEPVRFDERLNRVGSVGFYERWVPPHIVNWACGTKAVRSQRRGFVTMSRIKAARRLRRLVWVLVAIGALVVGVGCSIVRPDNAIRIATSSVDRRRHKAHSQRGRESASHPIPGDAGCQEAVGGALRVRNSTLRSRSQAGHAMSRAPAR